MSAKLNLGNGTVPVYGAAISEDGYVVIPVKGTFWNLPLWGPVEGIVVELQKVEPLALVVGYAPCRLYAV